MLKSRSGRWKEGQKRPRFINSITDSVLRQQPADPGEEEAKITK